MSQPQTTSGCQPISGTNIAKLLLNEQVVSKLRGEIKADSGYRLPLNELAQVLLEEVMREDVQGDPADRQLKRARKASRTVPTKVEAPACAEENHAE